MKRKVVPERLAYLRSIRNLTQQRLAEELNEADPSLDVKVTQIMIAAWENARRPVPEKYIDSMMMLFNVSKSYLMGLTDDPEQEFDKKVLAGIKEPPQPEGTFLGKIEISLDKIHKYHNEPVYVQFTDYRYKSAWGIYDKNKRQIIFTDMILEIKNLKKLPGVTIYAIKPPYLSGFENYWKSPLSMAEMLSKKRVYVRMISQDSRVNEKLDGWYHHASEAGGLVNNLGYFLPYEGLGFSYNAFSEG